MEDDYALVAVCNGRYYGGGFMPVAEARMDDGVLNTLVVKRVSRLTFMKFVNPYSKGQYYKFPHLARCSTPKVIRIRSEKPDIVTCLDGECITSDDVTIQLSDKRLNFFGPAGCSCNRHRSEAPEFNHFVNFCKIFRFTPLQNRKQCGMIISVSTPKQ